MQKVATNQQQEMIFKHIHVSNAKIIKPKYTKKRF